MSTTSISLLTEHFSQYISDHKKEFMERVLAARTRHVTVVLEDIYQSQNASAVIRTCECLGIQDIHIIQNSSKYSVNPKVLKGSDKWLDLHHYRKRGANNSELCFKALHDEGYTIVVTVPTPDCVTIDELPTDKKIAIVMGNELKGISSFALQAADAKVTIPMFGFTESLNLSVSAAICLNTIMPKVRSNGIVWSLTDEQKSITRLNWYRKVVRNSGLIEKEFLSRLAKK